MATNLAINNDLLTSAYMISGLKTKKDTVNLALEEFIRRRKRKDAAESLGPATRQPVEITKSEKEADGGGSIPAGSENELFGLWQDRDDTHDVAQYIRTMRRGRKL